MSRLAEAAWGAQVVAGCWPGVPGEGWQAPLQGPVGQRVDSALHCICQCPPQPWGAGRHQGQGLA
jgi:hypothetical protein